MIVIFWLLLVIKYFISIFYIHIRPFNLRLNANCFFKFNNTLLLWYFYSTKKNTFEIVASLNLLLGDIKSKPTTKFHHNFQKINYLCPPSFIFCNKNQHEYQKRYLKTFRKLQAPNQMVLRNGLSWSGITFNTPKCRQKTKKPKNINKNLGNLLNTEKY